MRGMSESREGADQAAKNSGNRAGLTKVMEFRCVGTTDWGGSLEGTGNTGNKAKDAKTQKTLGNDRTLKVILSRIIERQKSNLKKFLN